MPAHAANVRLENIYGDHTYNHHIDVVSSKNVVVDGYWATRGGESGSDAPVQFDAQYSGASWNGVWDGSEYTLVEDDDTPTRNCTLKTSRSLRKTAQSTAFTSTTAATSRSRSWTAISPAASIRRSGPTPTRRSRI